MPKVPEYQHKPLKPVYQPHEGPATVKQKGLIITLHERRRLPVPDLKGLNGEQASILIDRLLNPR